MKRKSIPRSLQGELLAKCRRRCSLCYLLDSDLDEKRGQISHIDHNPNNSAEDNLVFLCLRHHDEYDTTTSQSKGITAEEVRRAKRELIPALERLAQALEHPVKQKGENGASTSVSDEQKKAAIELASHLQSFIEAMYDITWDIRLGIPDPLEVRLAEFNRCLVLFREHYRRKQILFPEELVSNLEAADRLALRAVRHWRDSDGEARDQAVALYKTLKTQLREIVER